MFSPFITPEIVIIFFCKICPAKHTILLRHPLSFVCLTTSGWICHCISFLRPWNIWLVLTQFLTLIYHLNQLLRKTQTWVFNMHWLFGLRSFCYSSMLASLPYPSVLHHAQNLCSCRSTPIHVLAFSSFGYAEQSSFYKVSSIGFHEVAMLATEEKSSLAEAKHGESASVSGVHWWTVTDARGMSAGSIICSSSQQECMAYICFPEQQQ